MLYETETKWWKWQLKTSDNKQTSTKGTMDPEGAHLLTQVYHNAYGKPHWPPVHKYSSLRSTAHHDAACSRQLR